MDGFKGEGAGSLASNQQRASYQTTDFFITCNYMHDLLSSYHHRPKDF